MFFSRLKEINLQIPEKASFTMAEVAQILGVTEQTIYCWVRHGQLASHGKPKRITRAALIEFIASGLRQGNRPE